MRVFVCAIPVYAYAYVKCVHNRLKPQCGPHNFPPALSTTGDLKDQSIIDLFSDTIERLPGWVSVLLGYLTNVLLLWLIIGMTLLYVFVLRKRSNTVCMCVCMRD